MSFVIKGELPVLIDTDEPLSGLTTKGETDSFSVEKKLLNTLNLVGLSVDIQTAV